MYAQFDIGLNITLKNTRVHSRGGNSIFHIHTHTTDITTDNSI